MLKKMSIRKIMVATFTLFILALLYLIPSNKERELKLATDNIEYVYDNRESVIYLLDSDDYIARTMIPVCDCEGTEVIKDVMEGLIEGGSKSNIIPNGFRSIIPSGTKINALELNDGILTINFSKELLDINEKYEEKMLEAIVFTLTSIDGIDKVVIEVEGEVLDKLPQSGKALPKELDKTIGINKHYELTSMQNIDSLTTYYISTYNDNYYYVPVTKYINNDNQDKIKVIIEQMSSAPVYESNLMSFLNVNTKLLNYELQDKELKLYFDDSILGDVTNNNILEEVVYTISLSMQDNFNVEDVVFYANDEEICKSDIKSIE